MSKESIRPSTLEGIKRLAKAIKLQDGIKHQPALDKAAQQGGFQNFRHARNLLSSEQSADVRLAYPIYLTAYWRDAKDGTSGRETLQISLGDPWSELLTRRELRMARGLASFRPEGPDHLAVSHVMRSQLAAHSAICHAARTLQFVSATRLKPSTRAYPKGNIHERRIPGEDHSSVWRDEQKRYLIADEPYENSLERRLAERARWCNLHGFTEVKPSWPGMHNPYGGARLILLSNESDGVPLEPIVAALGRLPAPPSELNWKGESAPRLPWFVSPGTVAKAQEEAAARERAKQEPRKPVGKHNTVGYNWTLVGPQRRPNARMPIKAHAEVGQLLKEILAVSYRRKGVYNRVDAIRSELDEWTQREYNRSELSDDKFFALYYHDSSPPTDLRFLGDEERARNVSSLTRVKATLAKHYPDCAPLRAMLKRADAAIASLQTWT